MSSIVKPVGLINGHYECRSFDETIPILTDVLALEVVERREKEMVVKHPNTDWRLIVHENGRDTPDKPVRNHYGVRVATNQEVERANEFLLSKKKELRIKIIKPKEHHNGFSVHFYEPGGNFWEIESYENAVKGGMGQTTAPHWETPLPEERFPGKGYVPQALTHGTIENEDLESCRSFYRDVLGFEIVQLWETSFYVKHPSTPWYVVCLNVPKENRNYLTRYQRYTLAVESSDAVHTAHRELTQKAGEIGITELEDVKEDSENTGFLFSDRNKNWWEIACQNH